MDNVSARGPWPYVLPDQRTQRELRHLNLQFLELVCSLSPVADAVLGLDRSVAARIAGLRPARRTELASCPYALHGFSLHDRSFWGTVRQQHIPERVAGRAPGLDPGQLADVRDFLFLALAYGWHLAATNPIAARWMLGATAVELRRLSALPFGTLRQIASACPGLLRARLCDQRRFWEDLVEAAESGSKQARFAAVSLGLQLSAAAGAARPCSED